MEYQQHIEKIAQRLSHIAQQTQFVCEQSELARHPPQIIAVSKNQPQSKLIAALEIGHRHFGENRVQEAYQHWQPLKSRYPNITLHLIGPLQSNKVAEAVALFDVIHTIDRDKIAARVQAECAKQQRNLPCFIQVNTGDEEQKAGIATSQADAFIEHCMQDVGLNVIGLMCIPPVNESAAHHFALLQAMAQRHGLRELSMGMSADYQLATRMGATFIRVGTSLFGEREPS